MPSINRRPGDFRTEAAPAYIRLAEESQIRTATTAASDHYVRPRPLPEQPRGRVARAAGFIASPFLWVYNGVRDFFARPSTKRFVSEAAQGVARVLPWRVVGKGALGILAVVGLTVWHAALIVLAGIVVGLLLAKVLPPVGRWADRQFDGMRRGKIREKAIDILKGLQQQEGWLVDRRLAAPLKLADVIAALPRQRRESLERVVPVLNSEWYRTKGTAELTASTIARALSDQLRQRRAPLVSAKQAANRRRADTLFAAGAFADSLPLYAASKPDAQTGKAFASAAANCGKREYLELVRSKHTDEMTAGHYEQLAGLLLEVGDGKVPAPEDIESAHSCATAGLANDGLSSLDRIKLRIRRAQAQLAQAAAEPMTKRRRLLQVLDTTISELLAMKDLQNYNVGLARIYKLRADAMDLRAAKDVNFAQKQQDLASAADTNPENRIYSILAGDAFFGSDGSEPGDADRAAQYYERVVRLTPAREVPSDEVERIGTARAFYRVSKVAGQENARQVDLLRRAVELDPDNVSYFMGLVRPLNALGRASEAKLVALRAAKVKLRNERRAVRRP